MTQSLRLPAGVEITAGPRGPLIRGNAQGLFPAVINGIRQLAHLPVGSRLRVGGFTLVSATEPASLPNPDVVVLPPDAWNVLASKFAEVVEGREQSPFYFGQCGYLHPPPATDLGVELLGEPL